MFENLIYILYGLFFIYFAVSVFYLFLLTLGGKFFYKTVPTQNSENHRNNRIAILVPAYREDGIIISTAENLLSLDYPRQNFDVYIIADSFLPETIVTLRKMPLKVIEVSFEKSTKTKALNSAFDVIPANYEIALICDADNMLARDFLKKIDNAFARGSIAVQGRRVAKNLDSPFATLDACSEAINNNIFRKGNNGIGLSSAVIGSGMAFEFDVVKNILSKINAVGGFDKILQLEVVKKGASIRYLEDAIVFDEKVSTAEAFQQQRKRWVSSQFVYFRQFFLPALQQLFKGNLSYFNLAVLCNIVLPRAFLLVILPIFAALSFFLSSFWGLMATGIFVLYLITLAIALPRQLVNKQLLRAALSLPKASVLMILTIFQIRKANKKFIHTVHSKTEVTNIQFQDKVR